MHAGFDAGDYLSVDSEAVDLTARIDQVRVLMVEDSQKDRLLLRIALSKNERSHFIGSISDGQELLGYMRGEGKYADREKYPLPDKMLLDMEVPRKEGFEVVEWLRGQPFEDMVVVVFHGSERVQGIEKAAAVGTDFFPARTAPPNGRLPSTCSTTPSSRTSRPWL